MEPGAVARCSQVREADVVLTRPEGDCLIASSFLWGGQKTGQLGMIKLLPGVLDSWLLDFGAPDELSLRVLRVHLGVAQN